ncbi:hypothetical protein EVAR_90124_1 [Eumeta japonica]|uniref:Uncharacterized protein n=1 Tax=Eumeta variegata TaxID=151549 RepID=A0A4C2A0P2_EUMVA|nr:hypothetical protein EVAR_90124_1 [Eumeta japonica]
MVASTAYSYAATASVTTLLWKNVRPPQLHRCRMVRDRGGKAGEPVLKSPKHLYTSKPTEEDSACRVKKTSVGWYRLKKRSYWLGSVHKLRSSTKGGRDKLKRYAEARNRGEGVESKATWFSSDENFVE